MTSRQSEFCESLTCDSETWFSATKAIGVTMQISDLDMEDPNLPVQDYYAVREFRFAPERLDKAFIEIIVTEDDGVGVTIESRGRVYERCGRSPRRAGVVIMGMEPVDAVFKDIKPLLEFAAGGQLVINTYALAGCLFIVPVTMPAHNFGWAFHSIDTSGLPERMRRTLLSWVQAPKTTLSYRPWPEYD